MNKKFAKKIFIMEGLPTPASKIVSFEEAFSKSQMDVPYVIKPVAEGSSLGVYIVLDPTRPPEKPKNWAYGHEVLVEEYIPGVEISIAVLGDRALGALELHPKEGFYDYDAKYKDGKTEHYMPARIPENAYSRALSLAVKAHHALECKGISRVDMRYNPEKDELFLLEVNTQPGFTPLSIVPEIAAHSGMSFHDLIDWMIENAINEK